MKKKRNANSKVLKKGADDKKGAIEFIIVAVCIILIIALLFLGLMFVTPFSAP